MHISVYKDIVGISFLTNCKISDAGVQAKGKMYPWNEVAGVAEFPEMPSLMTRTPASACLVFLRWNIYSTDFKSIDKNRTR